MSVTFYFYKKKDSNGGKLFAGPVWDFNLGYGNFGEGAWEEPWKTHSWNATLKGVWKRVYWFNRLLDDPKFEDKLMLKIS